MSVGTGDWLSQRGRLGPKREREGGSLGCSGLQLSDAPSGDSWPTASLEKRELPYIRPGSLEYKSRNFLQLKDFISRLPGRFTHSQDKL